MNPSRLQPEIKIAFHCFSKIVALETKDLGFKAGATSFYLFLLDYLDEGKTADDVIKTWTNKE